MSNVKILDCTLRDGGYVNSWHFGKKAIENIIFNLSMSNTDIVECGFLTNQSYDADYSLFNSVEHINERVMPSEKSGTMYVAMIAMGEREIDPRLLSDASKTVLDGIRLTFHPHEIDRAFEWAKIIKDKGYKLFMQPVGTTNYTDKQFLDLLERINILEPYAFYIVDTLGIMYEKDLLRQVFLVDNNLKTNIKLGYHSHNNFQLAFSNAQALAEYNTERTVIIDCSANGMGRGAGNLCSELFMDYINKTQGIRYDVLPVLEIVDQYLVPISLTSPWGYNSAYFLSAANNCHPNYATHLIAKHSLSMTAIGNILHKIPKDEKRFFNKELIEKIYITYQNNAVDDLEVIGKLRKKLSNKHILVIAPGASVKSNRKSIKKYIAEKDPYIISVNFVPDFVKPDLLFVGNALRYEKLKETVDYKNAVFTSNIPNLPKNANKVNYSELVDNSTDVSDSSGMMLLKLLCKASVKSAVLAGYDGFKRDPLGNYFNNDYCGAYDPVILQEKNLAIQEEMDRLSEKLKIKFITPSLYEKKKRSKKEEK
ncbi:MAG: aldolase catalytic domain-containing protein [Acutalibacteraceae bacterium]